MIEKLLRLDISDGSREKIMGLNAERLLNDCSAKQ
jgi:predicted TIM-barrel fold metal-dependent hydrolase